jgi:putative serine protease PepD
LISNKMNKNLHGRLILGDIKLKAWNYLVALLAGAAGAAAVAIPVADSHHNTRTVTVQSDGGHSEQVSNAAIDGINVNSIYKKDEAGVVDILVTQKVNSTTVLGTGSQLQQDEGAGVVINKSGDIVTDEHVVGTATTAKITFANGKTATAKVLGKDASTDVAVLKVRVSPSELDPIALDTQSNIQVGDSVIAIGSPFNLPETVTSGIVSQVGRSITAPNGYAIAGAVQTDAAINPGNSGGPLLNSQGQVLGLNDQIETENSTSTGEGSSSGVGFAIPATSVKKIADEIMAHQPIRHAFLGVELGALQTEATVETVIAGGPAALAGLGKGDVITKFDGVIISKPEDLIAEIGNLNPGQKVTVDYTHDGVTKVTQLTLGSQPARPIHN